MSWKFTDELSVTFQSSVSGAGEFGHSLMRGIFEFFTAPPAPTPPPCKDDNYSCANYKTKDYCDYYSSVQQNCRKTCGLCGTTVDCKWSEWGQWSSCSKTAYSCSKERTRTISQKAQYGGKGCYGSDKETKSCNEEECKGIKRLCHHHSSEIRGLILMK